VTFRAFYKRCATVRAGARLHKQTGAQTRNLLPSSFACSRCLQRRSTVAAAALLLSAARNAARQLPRCLALA